MNKIVRNILSVFVILFTVMVILVWCGIGVEAQNDIYYDLAYDAELEIIGISAEKIGKVYNNKESEEDHTFYRVDIKMKNDTNISVERSGSQYSYEAEDGYVQKIYNDGVFAGTDYCLIPADSEGYVSVIVQIPDGNERLELYSWENEELRYEVEIPQ